MRGLVQAVVLATLVIAEQSGASTTHLRVIVGTEGSHGAAAEFSRFAFYNGSADGNNRFSGFTVDVMNQAAKHANLELDLQLPKVAEDRKSLIEELNRNRTDMLGGLWAISVDNIKRGADWTVPYHIGHVGALVRRKSMGDDMWGFFAPFTPLAWVWFFMMVFMYGGLTYVLEQGSNEEFPNVEHQETKIIHVITEFIWHSAMFSLKDRDKPIRTSAAKLLSVVFSFVVIVVLASYTANLAAFMIDASSTAHFVRSEEDLKSKSVAVLCGGSTERWIKKNNMAHTVQCSSTMSDSVDLVKKGLVNAVLGWSDELHYYAAKDCEVEVSSVTMHATEFSFPVARSDNVPNWRYKFNAALFKLRETGEFHKLRQKWFSIEDATICEGSGSELNPNKAQIKLTNVIGLAGILTVGLLVGGLIEVARYAHQLLEDFSVKYTKSGSNKEPSKNNDRPAEDGIDPSFKESGIDEAESLLKSDDNEEPPSPTNPHPSAGPEPPGDLQDYQTREPPTP